MKRVKTVERVGEEKSERMNQRERTGKAGDESRRELRRWGDRRKRESGGGSDE